MCSRDLSLTIGRVSSVASTAIFRRQRAGIPHGCPQRRRSGLQERGQPGYQTLSVKVTSKACSWPINGRCHHEGSIPRSHHGISQRIRQPQTRGSPTQYRTAIEFLIYRTAWNFHLYRRLAVAGRCLWLFLHPGLGLILESGSLVASVGRRDVASHGCGSTFGLVTPCLACSRK